MGETQRVPISMDFGLQPNPNDPERGEPWVTWTINLPLTSMGILLPADVCDGIKQEVHHGLTESARAARAQHKKISGLIVAPANALDVIKQNGRKTHER